MGLCPIILTRPDQQHAFAVVRQVLHGWDPYGLVGSGAPADEWDGEAASLVSRLSYIHSDADATAAISAVFSEAFQPEGFSLADCATAGRQLFSALMAAALVTPGS